MSDLTEFEILECLKTNLRAAAIHCIGIAENPQTGPYFRRFRDELKLAEGCCRQMAGWRGDTRWLPIGIRLEQAHQHAVRWLRYHHPRPLFHKLAYALVEAGQACACLETAATGRLGLILPDVQRIDRTAGRPMQIILPH